MGIHEAASVGFSRAADAYERGRPGYPAAAVEFVVRELAIDPGSTVLDLAAGTGKLTSELAATGATVIAVEPLEAMRQKLTEKLPDVRVLAGTAEAIPLPDASVDAVTVAQAFHWFDGPAALREIHRVLWPARKLALIWNLRDERVGWVAQLSQIVEQYRSDAPGEWSSDWRAAFDGNPLFTPLQEQEFAYEQELDRDALLARVESISFISALPADEREQVLSRAAKLVADADRIVLPYRTKVYWTTRPWSEGLS